MAMGQDMSGETKVVGRYKRKTSPKEPKRVDAMTDNT